MRFLSENLELECWAGIVLVLGAALEVLQQHHMQKTKAEVGRTKAEVGRSAKQRTAEDTAFSHAYTTFFLHMPVHQFNLTTQVAQLHTTTKVCSATSSPLPLCDASR